MEVYKLRFKHYKFGTEPIVTTFDMKELDYPNCELELYIIEDQGFRVFHYRDDSKIVYIDVDYKNGDDEYYYYFKYVKSFKRDSVIKGILS